MTQHNHHQSGSSTSNLTEIRSKPPSNSLINLLVIIILNSLSSDLVQTAIFFSERLHTLIPSSELAVWLLSLCLLRSGDYRSTIHLLRNTPIFIPTNHPTNRINTNHHHNHQNQHQDGKGKGKLLDDDPFNSINKQKDEMDDSMWDWNHEESVKGIQRTANMASTRCALVYSKACSLANRPKEGLEVYLRAIEEFGTICPNEGALINSAANAIPSTSSAYTLLANLAFKAHEYEKASEFYCKALTSKPDGHLCWEAFEGLCQTTSSGVEVDVDEIFGKTSTEEYFPGYMDLDDEYIYGTFYASTDHRQMASLPIASNAPINLKPPPLAAKDAFRMIGTNGRNQQKKYVVLENSFGESSNNSSFAVNSFENYNHPNRNKAFNTRPNQLRSNYLGPSKNGVTITPSPSRHAPIPQRLFSFTPTDLARQGGNFGSIPLSSTPNIQQTFDLNPCTPPVSAAPLPASPNPFHDFTPSSNNTALEPLPPLIPNGKGPASVKRTRSQTQAHEVKKGSSLAPKDDFVSKFGPMSPGNANSSKNNSNSNNNNKNDKKPNSDTGIFDPHIAKMASMKSLAKEEAIENGRLLRGGPRETKRVKSNGNMARRPPTSQSPVLNLKSYPIQPPPSIRYRQSKVEAIEWIVNVLKKFARAYLNLNRFRCEDVLNEIMNLPYDQKRSWRAYCLIGRARFELLDYKSAEIAFKKARECFPHLVTHMDIYSTLLWHLRKTTSLSYLSQELQLINPQAPETWIATGNLFSRLEDHPSALKCFQRSTQVSNNSNEYSYTLSGHECLMLEEYSRSLIFFRESIRRNPTKNYNAYFGLGEVYFKQDKFRLAKYFFEKAFKINSSNPLILCGIGKVYEKLGNFKESLKVYNRALNFGNCCYVASVKFSRAKVLFGLGKFELARKDLIELTKIVPTEFNVRFLLGKCYGILGDYERCIKELTYSQDLQPKSSNQIKKILNELNNQMDQKKKKKKKDDEDEDEDEDGMVSGRGRIGGVGKKLKKILKRGTPVSKFKKKFNGNDDEEEEDDEYEYEDDEDEDNSKMMELDQDGIRIGHNDNETIDSNNRDLNQDHSNNHNHHHHHQSINNNSISGGSSSDSNNEGYNNGGNLSSANLTNYSL